MQETPAEYEADRARVSPPWDEQDADYAAEMMAAYDAKHGPRVGDWVLVADETRSRRIAAIHHGPKKGRVPARPERFQLTSRWGGGNSFHLTHASVAHSGGLDSALPIEYLADTGQTRDGWVWVWHHGRPGGGQARDGQLAFRVWRYIPSSETSPADREEGR